MKGNGRSGPANCLVLPRRKPRAPEQSILLQGKLQALGFVPKDAVMDGVFGTGTRTALLEWQHSTGRPETGFFGDADAAVLLGATATSSSPPDPLAGLRSKPLARADYSGQALTIGYENLQVVLDTETSNDTKVCHAPNGGGLSVGVSNGSHQAGCNAVLAKVEVDGKGALTATVALLADDTDVDKLRLEVEIMRLDAATALPQVVISGWTGGAHCCTSTAIVTARADGIWQIVGRGGDQRSDFLDIARDGSSVFVDIPDGFLYQYASYAGSYAPTRIRRLKGITLQDATRDPRYRKFLLGELQSMEDRGGSTLEPNGYLAGWVAQKALVGQLEDGWRVMLASYDHQSTDGLSTCAVDKRLWTKSPYGADRVCPDGEGLMVSFPEALALHLVELGYITPEQSASLGYDPAKIEADRKPAMEAATARY